MTMRVAAKPKSVCILGAGGFIGSHLLLRLITSGRYRIYAIDLCPDKIQHLLNDPCLTYVNFDIHNRDRLGEYVGLSDTVISLVALCNPSLYNTIPIEVVDANFLRPFEVVQTCAAMGKWLIQFSTSEVYGMTAAHAASIEHHDAHPDSYVLSEDSSPLVLGPVSAQRWSYAASKQLLERVIYAYGFERNLAYTIVRPFNFIGPRMDYIPGIDGEGVPRVLACFMEALMCGRPLKLVDGGVNRRCFTYIDDAVDAMEAILERPARARGQIFNIGNPENEVSIAQLADLMISLYREITAPMSQTEIAVHHVSSKEFYGEGYQDSDRRVPDISKARALLGWEPKTGLEAALRHTISSYVRDYGAECAGRAAC